jgi:hypothetical protein
MGRPLTRRLNSHKGTKVSQARDSGIVGRPLDTEPFGQPPDTPVQPCPVSVIEELDAAIIGNLKRAERLRQSIVHRTFAGAMPPQPN